MALRFGLVVSACLVGSLMIACGASNAPDQDQETTESTESALNGCHTVCPKCRPGQICSMMACYQVCHGNTPGSCTVDADCRTFSDYCTGCDCRALSSNQPDPTCSGPGVRCFADPCMGVTAVCLNGSCALQ